jgi:hypothetical protein
MLFAGWVTLLFTFGFFTLDFLGAIFFWYFSLRKIFEENRNFVEPKCALFAARVPEDPRRLKRKI